MFPAKKIAALLIILAFSANQALAFLSLEDWKNEKETNLTITGLELSKDKYVDRVAIKTTGWIEPKETYTFNPPAIILDFPVAPLKKELSVLAKSSKRIKKVYTRPNPEVKNQIQVVVELWKEADYEVINIFGKNICYIEISDIKKPVPPTVKPKMPLAGKLIAIDPGHGGGDVGAFSASGKPEKDFCLATALKLAQILRNQGASVYLTREKDKDTNFREFMPEVNDKKADIFIGIHYNAFESQGISGTETFYFNRESKPLAAYVQQNMLNALGRRDRGIKRRMHYVTHHAEMPSIIIEPLYITNREEEALAENSKTQSKIANAVAEGIKEYLINYRTN
ncbi:MAG: N-acetylmuramoyl-L-alanine amidase [Candidatus Saganbacteria bacterium]|nr:N-acetylmuramoyl-L-alanine amidase [Candidatus Saganbacteria bacterium]